MIVLQQIFELLISFMIGGSIIAIVISVILSFLDSHGKVKTEKKSVVETGTMFLFFFVYYFVLRFHVGEISVTNLVLKNMVMGVCSLIVVFSAYVNVYGRTTLGKLWANNIKIYSDHKLIRTGMYKYVRHPLYASLIWAFLFGSLVFFNYLAFILNLIIFLPAMYYRARQEEELLGKAFKEYKEYKREVGMFFPKF